MKPKILLTLLLIIVQLVAIFLPFQGIPTVLAVKTMVHAAVVRKDYSDVAWISNIPVSVGTGMPAIITRDHLRIEDGNVLPNDLIYRISQIPNLGRLRLDGNDLNVNDAFTQGDIDTGKLVYLNDSGTPGQDVMSFQFSSPEHPAIERVSVGNGGLQANFASSDARMSTDGNSIVFDSAAQNLVAQDTFGLPQVYFYDRLSQQIHLISEAMDGSAGQGISMIPAISPNGRYVAFSSNADSFGITPPTSSTLELYFQDQSQTVRQTDLISKNLSNQPGDGNSYFSTISNDGRYVAYLTEASNLVPKWGNYDNVPVVYDRLTEHTYCVAWDAVALVCRPGSPPIISADGQWITFSTWDGLIPEDTNNWKDYYLFSTMDHGIQLISKGVDGQPSNQATGNSSISISSDGRYIAYGSQASNLVPIDTNGEEDIFMFDRITGLNELVTINSKGEQAIANQFPIEGAIQSISADGRYIAFFSNASNLDLWDQNDAEDLFLRDRQTQLTQRVILPRKPGSAANLYNDFENVNSFTITADGGEILFGSEGNWLVPGDTNESLDFFIFNLHQQGLFHIQVDSPLTAPQIKINNGLKSREGTTTTITSSDLFVSSSLPVNRNIITLNSLPQNGVITLNNQPLQAGNYFSQEDINQGRLSFHAVFPGTDSFSFNFGYEPLIQRISLDPNGIPSSLTDFWYPSISYDGRFIPITLQENNISFVYIRDMQTGNYEKVAPGLYGNISGNGRYVVFMSDSQNIILGIPASLIGPHLFRYDRLDKTFDIIDTDPNGIPSENGIGDCFGVSFDGQKILFVSLSSLLPGSPSGSTYVRNMQTGQIELISIDSEGNPITPYWSMISGDGQTVVFGNYVRDLRLQTTTQTLLAPGSQFPSISYDGRYIASVITDGIISGDTNGFSDIAMYDQKLHTYHLESVTEDGTSANGASILPTISPDGQFVSFSTGATNLLGTGNSSIAQIIVRDRSNSRNRPVSLSAAGDSGNNHSAYTAMPVGGSKVFFSSYSNNLVPDGSLLIGQYMVDLSTNQDHFELVVDPSWTLFLPVIGR